MAIKATKVLGNDNQLWIKAEFKSNPVIRKRIEKVCGAFYVPKHKAWAVPYSSKSEFTRLCGDFLITWYNEDVRGIRSGIDELTFDIQPIPEHMSVHYKEDMSVESATGFKLPPIADYQVRGFNAMYTTDFLILADDAGLGKSAMSLWNVQERIREGRANNCVIVCKASLLFNWRDEVLKHTELTPIVLAGTPTARNKVFNDIMYNEGFEVLIVSYETYRSEIYNFLRMESTIGLDILIVDEGHKIKNPRSKIGKIVHHVNYKAKYVLTASPIINSPIDGFNYLHLGGITSLNIYQFEHRYTVKGGYGGKEIIGYKNMQELQGMIQSCMLRRLKTDKLKGLKDPSFEVIKLAMPPKQRKLYNAVKEEIVEELKELGGEDITAPNVLSKLLRLQQVTDLPSMLDVDNVPSVKVDALDELLDRLIKEEGRKVILFSKFKAVTDYLHERYAEYNPAVVDGMVSTNGVTGKALTKLLESLPEWEQSNAEEREALEVEYSASPRQRQVYKFQKDPTCMLFIGSTSACREGLTLTASSDVVFFDNEWAWEYKKQAYSRAHRIGQESDVTVYDLICVDSIDETVAEVLEQKRLMVDSILTTTSTSETKSLLHKVLGGSLCQEEV